MASELYISKIKNINGTQEIIDTSTNVLKTSTIKAADGTDAITIADSTGEATVASALKTSTIKAADGTNAITIADSTGELSLHNGVRLPSSGGIKDSSGNSVLTESGGVVTVGENVVGGVPAGAIMSFAMASPPSGWLVCDGSALSRTTYASLFTVVGTTWGVGDGSTTFNLPDLRGEFLRGFDNGAGNDPNAESRIGGDAVGSSQEEEFKSHNHPITFVKGSPNGSSNYGYATVGTGNNTGVVNTTTSGRGGSETRPRNISVQYCIKY